MSFQRSLKLCEEFNNRILMASAVLHIGRIHMNQGRYDQALEYYDRGMKLFEGIDDIGGMSVALNFIADFYTVQGYYDEALRYYYCGLSQFEKEGEKWLIAQVLNSIGVILTKLERYADAMENLQSGLTLRKELGERPGIAETMTNIGIIHMMQGSFDSALSYSTGAYAIAKEIGAIAQLKDASKTMSDVYALKHDFSFAYEYHKEYTSYKDSLINEDNAMHAMQDVKATAQSSTSAFGQENLSGNPEIEKRGPTIWISTAQTKGNVEIRVRDNGTGIPADLQQKIFQPFFTTKPSDEGTGLGLSISYDIIVSGHGGTLTCNGNPGHGAEFVITVPAASAPAGKG